MMTELLSISTPVAQLALPWVQSEGRSALVALDAAWEDEVRALVGVWQVVVEEQLYALLQR